MMCGSWLNLVGFSSLTVICCPQSFFRITYQDAPIEVSLVAVASDFPAMVINIIGNINISTLSEKQWSLSPSMACQVNRRFPRPYVFQTA